MKIITGELKTLAEKAGENLAAHLKENNSNDIFLLLAGGTCIEALKYVPSEVLGPHLTIGPMDDRFSRDPAINNMMALKKTDFFTRGVDADVNVADMIPEEGEKKESFATRYESVLRDWRLEFPKGVMIGLFGIGEDGHIGSIMPFPEDKEVFNDYFENPDVWVVGYDAGMKNPYPLRMTVTLPFMRENLKAAVAYAVGEKKKESIQRIQAESGEIQVTPARILRELPDATLYTDQSI